MKSFLVLSAIILLGCTGSLTEEQRKRMRENMEEGQIKKVSEAEIMQAAFDLGRKISTLFESTFTSRQVDSISQVYQVEIISIQTANDSLRQVEKQLLEAYKSDSKVDENVQKMGTDTLLYTKPVVITNNEGSIEFVKAIGVRMTRKQLVLSIKK